MLQKTFVLAAAIVLTGLAVSSKAHAWGAYRHVGYTHYSPYTGLHHYGYTEAYRGGYGGYGLGYGYPGYGGGSYNAYVSAYNAYLQAYYHYYNRYYDYYYARRAYSHDGYMHYSVPGEYCCDPYGNPYVMRTY